MFCAISHKIFWQDSAGVKHLQKLVDAGLTHLHLLPTFQFGDVDDEKENWKSVGRVYLMSQAHIKT